MAYRISAMVRMVLPNYTCPLYAMADINIQRKKSSPSPWLLILLVVAGLGIAAYFLFRAESEPPQDVPSPVGSGIQPPPDSTTGAETGPRPTADAVGDMAAETAPVTPDVLAGFAQGDASQPQYGREGLRLLTSALLPLADRDNLRDATIAEKRNDLTSATSRLQEDGSSLRPGYVAAAAFLQAVQQKAYPNLEAEVGELMTQAGALSGRVATPQDQTQVQQFLTRAAAVLRTINETAR